ncbi:hypothetical protein [Oerskovia flava]|uniref:hypothetical protein n=1 Tax=Oerskovia flava TaxID=2986422 RepID=UPI0022406411|nr:hypothetical protein [Oerskovia sp. JB1-3-2]
MTTSPTRLIPYPRPPESMERAVRWMGIVGVAGVLVCLAPALLAAALTADLAAAAPWLLVVLWGTVAVVVGLSVALVRLRGRLLNGDEKAARTARILLWVLIAQQALSLLGGAGGARLTTAVVFFGLYGYTLNALGDPHVRDYPRRVREYHEAFAAQRAASSAG